MLVRMTRDGITRSVLFDSGGTPDGLVHNMDCLGLTPRDWNCIVLSHGHWDHTLGLIGLHQRLGHLNFPLTLHPDAYLKRATLRPNGEIQMRIVLKHGSNPRFGGCASLVEFERLPNMTRLQHTNLSCVA